METSDIDIFAKAVFHTCFSVNDTFKVLKYLQFFDNVDFVFCYIYTHIKELYNYCRLDYN